MMTGQTWNERLRSQAKGVYALEAATELLIRAGLADRGRPWVNNEGWVDFDSIAEDVGALSRGEQHLLRIAASLAGATPCLLDDDLTGLDRQNTALVLAAVSHATGSHEDGEHLPDNLGLIGPDSPRLKHGPLYPWPDDGSPTP